ncbi:TPA: restriction endonuclease subunit S [Klebsiella aerogenes]|uniref:restriction endonuclease subunit S n=1 Tax=Enterobacteriaceae TaxID=543 RepID=UPI0013D8A4E6|nr:restriction endonuclease subunit S [Klebsiella aerogenes]
MSGGKLPEGWVETPLENIVEILDSMRIPVNNKERQKRIEGKDFNKLYPYYGATGEVGKIDDFIFDEELIALGEDGVPFFDGQKNKAYMLYGKTWVNNHAHVLKAIQGLSHNKFLCYFLNQFDYHDYVNGGTRLKLTQANMRKIPVRFAPFSEQKIIAEKLDTLLAQVESTKARLEQIPQILKRFRQAVLSAAVSGALTNAWRKNKEYQYDSLELGTLAKFIDYRGKTPTKTDSGIPLITAKNIRQGYISKEPREYIAEADYEKWMTRGIPSVGDVLITTEAPMGYIANINIEGKFALAQRAICLQFKDPINSFFASIYMQSSIFQQQLNENATGSTVKGIKASLLKKIKITFPPLSEQHEIVRRVEQLFAYADTIEKQVNNALARVNNLTQSILAKAFRGELTAQWRAENPDLISGENSAAALLEKIKAGRAASGGKKTSRKKA